MRTYMTDSPRRKSIGHGSSAQRSTVRDNLARRTHVSTYFGSEYSSLLEVDDLKIFDNSNDSQPPKLVCVYHGTAFAAENAPDDLAVYWLSADPVGTNTIGDSKGGMTAAKFQSSIVLKARRLAGLSR
jgi:hypothetical protein